MCAWSAGVFTRALGASQWQNDAAASIGIEAGIHDTQDNDLATGINTCLTKDGQNTATANLPMGGFKHTNIANATTRTEYVSLGQLVDGASTKVSSAGGTANAITLTLTASIPAYVAGQEFLFLAPGTNTGTTTVNVSGLGAKNIVRPGLEGALVAGDLISNKLYRIAYNGTSFVLMNCVPTINTWVPACTTGSGILSGVSTNGIYVVRLDDFVEFELEFVGTLSGGPSSLFGFTFPITADAGSVSRSVFSATATISKLQANAYPSSTTVGFVSFTSWANGTTYTSVCGVYRRA